MITRGAFRAVLGAMVLALACSCMGSRYQLTAYQGGKVIDQRDVYPMATKFADEPQTCINDMNLTRTFGVRATLMWTDDNVLSVDRVLYVGTGASFVLIEQPD